MAESVFEAVKQSVTVREAAQMYGIEVNRSDMACCPFHDDKNPSMKLNEEYFYCFGCGATGDVIDFTARLYNLSPKEAAEKLAQDFGLAYDSQAPPRRRYVRQKTEAQKFKEDRGHAFRVLADYFHLLRKWETDYTPKTPEENPHPRFMEAIQKKDYVGYLLDFFLEDTPDEQKLWIAEHQSEIAKLERRVKFMADKPTNRERLQEITAGIEQGIKELFESEKYMRYLSVMSKFHRYSVNNTMLIYMQRPDATLVAGFNKWKNQFERHVKKGEHGITIIAPTPYKKKIEEMKRGPDTQAPILDADGKAVMEEKEIEIPMFRPVKVFDVSQTDGKPLPELASSLSGTVPHYEAFLEALRRSAPVPIEFEPMAANMDGYFSSAQQRIAIREGMSEVQTVSAAVHETAHSKLHDPKKHEAEPTWKIVMVSEGGTKKDYRLDFATEAEAEQAAAEDGWRYVDENQFEWRLEVEEDLTAVKQAAKNRNTEEVEAESISYAVCQYFGIQTGENSFGYIASWSEGKELKELRASLETINKTSCELISDIERNYKEICKERGIDLTADLKPEQAPQQAAEEKTPAEEVSQPSAEYREALLVLDDTTYLHVQPCDTGWDNYDLVYTAPLSPSDLKALCAGDPRIKERMDLDVEVSKLKLMKADHQSKQYRLEDQLLKYFPEEIEKNKSFIAGLEADMATLAAHPHPEDGFAGMEVRGDVLTDKENAGAALLDACKEVKNSEPVQIGSYRGFAMSVFFDAWRQEYTLLLKGQMTHRASLGTDPRGNLTRIDNALTQMPQRLEATKAQLDDLYQQQAAAKEEVGKPFPYEEDLRAKSARLVELDTLLNLDGRGRSQPESVIAKSARSSVLDSLKRPVPPRNPEKKPKQHEEVR